MTALIEESASRVEQLVTRPGPTALRPPPDFDALRQACRHLEDGVLDLSASMDAGVEDYEVRKLLEFLAQLRRAIDAAGAGDEAPDAMALAAMQVHDVLRRLERRLEHTRWESPQEAAHYVFSVFDSADVPTTALMRLFGVSDKTISAWRQGGNIKTHADRVVLTAQLVSYLRPTLTIRGLLLWFDTEFDRLGDKTPLQLLSSDVKAAWEPLVSFARGGRDQLGS
jgi:hypothetical protein